MLGEKYRCAASRDNWRCKYTNKYCIGETLLGISKNRSERCPLYHTGSQLLHTVDGGLIHDIIKAAESKKCYVERELRSLNNLLEEAGKQTQGDETK